MSPKRAPRKASSIIHHKSCLSADFPRARTTTNGGRIFYQRALFYRLQLRLVINYGYHTAVLPSVRFKRKRSAKVALDPMMSSFRAASTAAAAVPFGPHTLPRATQTQVSCNIDEGIGA